MSARKEWVKARYSPSNGIRVTVSIQEDNISVSWTVKRHHGERLAPAVAEARKYAEAALAELQEATKEKEESSGDKDE